MHARRCGRVCRKPLRQRPASRAPCGRGPCEVLSMRIGSGHGAGECADPYGDIRLRLPVDHAKIERKNQIRCIFSPFSVSGPVGRCRRSPSPPGFCLRAPCPAQQGAAALAVLLTHLPLLPCGVRSTLSAPSLSGFDGCSARTAPAPSCAPPFSLRSTRTFRWNCRRRTAADAERTNAREGLRDSARRPSWRCGKAFVAGCGWRRGWRRVLACGDSSEPARAAARSRF